MIAGDHHPSCRRRTMGQQEGAEETSTAAVCFPFCSWALLDSQQCQFSWKHKNGLKVLWISLEFLMAPTETHVAASVRPCVRQHRHQQPAEPPWRRQSPRAPHSTGCTGATATATAATGMPIVARCPAGSKQKSKQTRNEIPPRRQSHCFFPSIDRKRKKTLFKI